MFPYPSKARNRSAQNGQELPSLYGKSWKRQVRQPQQFPDCCGPKGEPFGHRAERGVCNRSRVLRDGIYPRIALAGILQVLVLATVCSQVFRANGQQLYGSIDGNVTDSKDAAIRAASVTIRETTKGVVFTTTSNGSGFYSQGQLIPGTYVVMVEAPNFSRATSEPITVQIDNVSRLDVRLSPGTSTDVVVTATTPQLETDQADISTTFTGRDVLTLPDYQRNVLSLEFLVPGVTLPVGDSTASSENPQGSFRARINGRIYGATGYQLDGTDIQDAWLGSAIINPTPDSVAEAKLSTENFDAENGYVAGGLLAFSTKSGSNQFHGSLFEYLINNSPSFQTEGSDPFTQPNGPPPLKSNQFGGSLGGPEFHDKLFFFADAEFQRLRADDNVLTTVPTEEVRNTCFTVNAPGFCDLSQYLSNNAQVYNPNSGDYKSANPTGKNRTAFPNNQIPTSFLSQQAINILKYFPAPNITPSNGLIYQNNYLGSVAEVFNTHQLTLREDYYRSSKDQFFGRYTYAGYSIVAPGAFGSLAGGPSPSSINYAGNSAIHNQSLSVGYTRTVNLHMVNELRYGYSQYNVHEIPGGYGSQPATEAGMPGLNLDNTTTSGFPAFYIGGLSNIGYSSTVNKCNCSLTEVEQEHEIVDTFNISKQNHTFKFGADIRHTSNLRVPSDSHRAGELTAAAGYTALGGTSGGLGLATFLLGETTTFARYVSNVTDATAYLDRYHFFAQDSWHLTPRLTVNYGLRYELTLPEATGAGKGGLFDVNTGLVNVFGEGGNSSRGFQQTEYLNFAPRLALAYMLTPKTVVRAGYGWSYDTGDGGVFFNEANISYPAVIQQSNTPVNASQGVFNVASGPPVVPPPVLNGQGEVPLPAGVTGNTRPVHESLSVTYAYNAAIQREITKSLSVTAAYVGNSGRHVENDRNNNVNLNLSPFIPGQLASITTEPFDIKYGLSQAINDFCNCAVGQYNAFQGTVNLQHLRGYTLRGDYLYQRAYGDGTTSYTFLYDRAAGYGNNNSIYRSQLIATQFYDLPFGRGKLLASGSGKVVNNLLGDWSLSGVTIIHSGTPFTVSIGSFPSGYLGENTVSVSFPNRGAGSPYQGAQHNRNQWYQGCTVAALQNGTCAAFALPSQTALGNYGINNLYGPSYVDQDVAVQKQFAQVAERFHLSLRAEAFNVFNHPNLNTPSTNITSTSAGQITSTVSNMRRMQFAFRMNF
jgi:hypothetical protein